MTVAEVEKWKRAVVHLESVMSSSDHEDEWDALGAIQEGLLEAGRAGKIDQDRFKQLMEQAGEDWLRSVTGLTTRDKRKNGSAVYYSEDGRHYLLTARHVLWDRLQAGRDMERLKLAAPNGIARELEEARIGNLIVQSIFRVPSWDEVHRGISGPIGLPNLANLGAGPRNTHKYTFSDSATDLAVLSLDHKPSFIQSLKAGGYVPVGLEDFVDGPSQEGAEVFSVGYPASTSTLGERDLDSAEAHWASKLVSLPVSSFGRVAMLHADIPWFWADISIYPGNSGGPVVEDDKLVGIVGGQSTIPIDDFPVMDDRGNRVEIRIPFASVVKTQQILNILEIQKGKDARNSKSL